MNKEDMFKKIKNDIRNSKILTNEQMYFIKNISSDIEKLEFIKIYDEMISFYNYYILQDIIPSNLIENNRK
jgi:hypothetical protein